MCGMNLLWTDPRVVVLSLIALRPCSNLRLSWAPLKAADATDTAASIGGVMAAQARQLPLRDIRVAGITFDHGTEQAIELPGDKTLPLTRLLLDLQVCSVKLYWIGGLPVGFRCSHPPL
jgi:hypothetical protein